MNVVLLELSLSFLFSLNGSVCKRFVVCIIFWYMIIVEMAHGSSMAMLFVAFSFGWFTFYDTF